MSRQALPLLALLGACGPGKDDDTGEVCGPQDPVEVLEAVTVGAATGCLLQAYEDMLDDRVGTTGPWIEDVWVTATGGGEAFDLPGERILEYAAVPEVVRWEGRTWLFVVEGDLEAARERARAGSDWFVTHGLSGFGALELWVSDDGHAFTLVEDFGVEGLVQGMVVDPDVVRGPDGTWHLYYVGLPIAELVEPEAWADGADHTVWHATSQDLVHWIQQGPVVAGPNADPTVHCRDEARCMMASTGLDWSTSRDGGASFQFDGEWLGWGFAPEFFTTEDGRLRLYYNGKDYGGPLLSMISDDDGETWAEEGEWIPAYTVEAVTFAEDATGDLQMYYHYYQEAYRDEFPPRPEDGAGG